MKFCQSPYRPWRPGTAYLGAAGSRVERQQVACGGCDACIANRKQDWTGRLVMEALESASAAFVTLTYAKEPEEFQYKHIQTFLKGLRKSVKKSHGASVRFFCVGERGELFGRIHWHLLLFFSEKVHLRRMEPGEKWSLWRHGWAAIEMLRGQDRMVKKSRYCVMYALKDTAHPDTPRARMSLGRGMNDAGEFESGGPIGYRYAEKLAVATAQAGAVPDGKYRIPGIIWDKGHKAGEMQTFELKGALGRAFADRWRRAFEARYPEKDLPMNEWVMRHVGSDHAYMPRRRMLPREFGNLKLPSPELSRRHDGPSEVTGKYLAFGPVVAFIQVLPGEPYGWLEDEDGMRYAFAYSISEVLDLPEKSVKEVDAWIARARGPGWKGPEWNEQAKREETARKAERSAGLGAAVRAEIVRLREKHGVHPTAPGIYRTDYLAGRDAQAGRPVYTRERDILADAGCYGMEAEASDPAEISASLENGEKTQC